MPELRSARPLTTTSSTSTCRRWPPALSSRLWLFSVPTARKCSPTVTTASSPTGRLGVSRSRPMCITALVRTRSGSPSAPTALTGQRLTGADKRHAIELAYRAWPDLSQVRIATQVGCTQQYVSRVRGQLTTSCKLPDRVVGVDGRRRAATRPASSSRPEATPSSDAAADSPAPVAGDARSGLDVDSRPDCAVPVGSPDGDPSLPPLSESQVSQPPAPDVDRSEPSSSSDSAPAGPGERANAIQSVRDRSNRIVSVVAYDAKNLTAQEDLIEFAALDHAQVPDWIADLEEARRGLGRFIRRLRQEIADGSSSTPVED